MIWAPTDVYMIVGRVILGISFGATYVTVPQYTGEIADKEIRGFLTGMLEWTITFGVLFAYVIGALVNVFWLSVICSVFPIIYTIVFSFMPESPTFLILENREDEARKSFRFLKGQNFDPSEEIMEILKDKDEKEISTSTFLQAITRKSSLKAVFIGLIVIIFQPSSGINAVLSYSTKIFKSANTDLNSDVETIIVGAAFTIMTFLSTLFIDRLGRRKLLMISGIGVSISHIALSTFFYLQENDVESVSSLGWLPITAMSSFIIFYASGLGPIPCVVVGEILSADIKGKAAGFIMTANSIVNFLVAKFFPSLVESLGSGSTFLMFSVLCVVGTLLVFTCVPETKGKSLIEIQKILEENFIFCKF